LTIIRNTLALVSLTVLVLLGWLAIKQAPKTAGSPSTEASVPHTARTILPLGHKDADGARWMETDSSVLPRSEASLQPTRYQPANQNPSVLPQLDSLSREALLGMQAILRDQFVRSKNLALYSQWRSGIVHTVDQSISPAGNSGFALEDTKYPIIRQYRLGHDGSSPNCVEVRLEQGSYPELYRMRDDLRDIAAALKAKGYDPVLSPMFPLMGTGFGSTLFGGG
jgi:hypothetical protein